MMGWDDGGWSTGHWVAMSLMMLIFWGGLVAVVVWAVRSTRVHQQVSTPARTPDELLAERFAKGEIDEDEFTRRRELLHPGARPHGGTTRGARP